MIAVAARLLDGACTRRDVRPCFNNIKSEKSIKKKKTNTHTRIIIKLHRKHCGVGDRDRGSVGVRAVAAQPLAGAGHVHAGSGGRAARRNAERGVGMAEWRSVATAAATVVQSPSRDRAVRVPIERAPAVTLTLCNAYTHTHTHHHHQCTIIILSHTTPRAPLDRRRRG